MNAVEHAHATARLSVSVADASARIEVSDDGPGQPTPRKPDDDGGYGLWLVNWLAQTWGISQTGGRGKTVWFTLPLSSTSQP
jgi:signal transduction histidine kinase